MRAVEPRLDVMGLNNFAPYLMNRIMGRYNASLQTEISTHGLTTAQMRSLAVLSVSDGIRMSELAVYAVVQQSTLSRALDPLVDNGLVRREADQHDSRASRIYITGAGKEIYEKLWPHMAASCEAMFRGICGDERRQFVETLQKMLFNIRKHDF